MFAHNVIPFKTSTNDFVSYIALDQYLSHSVAPERAEAGLKVL